jgi:hypothetical protein
MADFDEDLEAFPPWPDDEPGTEVEPAQAPVPEVVERPVTDDDTGKALVVLRTLTAAGLRTTFDFDWSEAPRVWAIEIRDFSVEELDEAVREFVESEERDMPTAGQFRSVLLTTRRLEEERARAEAASAAPCTECDDIRYVIVHEDGGHSARPCSRCLPDRYDLYMRNHFTTQHIERGGCSECWAYHPSLAHRSRVSS